MPTSESRVESSEDKSLATDVTREKKEKEEAAVPKRPLKLRKKRSLDTDSGTFFKIFFACVYLLAVWSYAEHSQENISRNITLFIFHRLLGGVFCIAFISTWVQIIGLCGENGIQPVKDTMELLRKIGKSKASFPTVFWFNTSDKFIKVVCGGGLVTSMLYALNILPTLSLAISCFFFLSFKLVGREFFALQFDNLLIDTGVLALLLPPIRVLPFLTLPVTHFYQKSMIWLVWWLAFRLMLGSGLCKITSGDKTWRNGTALAYHYWSQPMPNWISYYADKSPLWVHRIFCYFHFFVELVVPFGVFFDSLALPTFLLLASLQMGIIVTGNYGHFNLLSILIPLSLIKDETYPQFIQSGMLKLMEENVALEGILSWVQNLFAVGIAFCVLALSLVPFTQVTRGALWYPDWVSSLHDKVSPFGILNYYGLFARMTTFRKEVIIEGSDGEGWKEYEFRYKVDNLSKSPRFMIGHLPRLDWRLWFCQFQQYNPAIPTWYDEFLYKLLQGSPEVLSLLEKNPFPDQPPRFIRSVMYDYVFANQDDHTNGYWWSRSKRRLWWPPCTLDNSGKMVYLMRPSLLS